LLKTLNGFKINQKYNAILESIAALVYTLYANKEINKKLRSIPLRSFPNINVLH